MSGGGGGNENTLLVVVIFFIIDHHSPLKEQVADSGKSLKVSQPEVKKLDKPEGKKGIPLKEQQPKGIYTFLSKMQKGSDGYSSVLIAMLATLLPL